MRTEAGNLPESLVFPIRNGLGVSNDRFGLKFLEILKRLDFQGPVSGFCLPVGGCFGSWLSEARLSLSFAFFTSDSLAILL